MIESTSHPLLNLIAGLWAVKLLSYIQVPVQVVFIVELWLALIQSCHQLRAGNRLYLLECQDSSRADRLKLKLT